MSEAEAVMNEYLRIWTHTHTDTQTGRYNVRHNKSNGICVKGLRLKKLEWEKTNKS